IKEYQHKWELPSDYKGPGIYIPSDQNINIKTVPKLFTPYKLRQMELKNRIVVSPTCQYSSIDGLMDDWHLVHYGGLAKGGAGLIILESTAVLPEGRISPKDAGLWNDDQIYPMKRITDFIHKYNAKVGLQLGHSGRKGSTVEIFLEDKRGRVENDEGGFDIVAPSAIQWDKRSKVPTALTKEGIQEVVQAFKEAAIRADKVGIDYLMIHGAHGYLINQFLSPLSNHRTDEYGGSFEGRTKFVLEIVAAIREVWPAEKPLAIRLSCTEWVEGGFDIDEVIRLAPLLHAAGVDIIDCSTGGNSSEQKVTKAPLYQVPFSDRIRKAYPAIATSAVGSINTPTEANSVLDDDKADLIVMCRAFLRNPFWPVAAAQELKVRIDYTLQYRPSIESSSSK
ncbi:hypothetical protein SAMD00019534_103240, partial [Acytostelium subglobosum LB1]|uniref:hypothetical protein n=1 Tax=Acytostelium subglobosum LB1 TaxID=1410327 RepID=UPI00064484A0